MYLDAPATKLLASKCACCSRALVDAVSIETGIGPICREKHGYDAPQMDADWPAVQVALGKHAQLDDDDRDAHALANRLVHAVAAEQKGAAVTAYTAAIRALGFTTLADRITERLVGRRRAADGAVPTGPAIEVTLVDGMLRVVSPYNAAAVEYLRAVPGRKRDGSADWFPVSSEAAVMFALRLGYAGEDALLPTGEVVSLTAVQPGEEPPVVAKPIPVVSVEVDGLTLIVRAPYSPEATEAFRGIQGRRFHGATKTNRFPMAAKLLVQAAIRRCYPGANVTVPVGVFGRPEDADEAALGEQFGIEMDATG